MIKPHEVSEARCNSSQQAIGEQPPQMKSSMVAQSLRCEGRYFHWSTLRGADMEGIGHHQGSAHSQTMQASYKTDE